MLRRLVDDDCVERFGSKKSEARPDTSCKDQTVFLDPLSNFIHGGVVAMELLACHCVVGVLLEIVCYHSDLGYVRCPSGSWDWVWIPLTSVETRIASDATASKFLVVDTSDKYFLMTLSTAL